MKAKFSGRCGICDGAIHVGDEIAEVDDDWCHKECAEDEGFLDDDE